MVAKTINREILDKLELSQLDNLDLTPLSINTLQQLDIWVDQYNHQVNPDVGISSSILLSMLVLEEITDTMIDDMLDELNQKETDQLDQLITDIQQNYKLEQLSNASTKEVISMLSLYQLLHMNDELDRIRSITIEPIITKDFPFDKLDQQYQQLMKLFTSNPVDTILLDSVRKHPNSLEDQLETIMNNWEGNRDFERLILRTIDLIKEQTKFRGGGPGEVQLPDYDDYYPEAYTQDKDWMPKVVMLAKHTKVWLNQLSRKYEKEIFQLDQIPDEELEEIASRGFTGLWLIGIWERSDASKRIKERMGNPDAAASAYSLWDYIVAKDLGGHEAYYNLSERAGKLNLRLASDMVPNHTGIMSKWMVEHPDWFIQTRDPPFPSYEFQSENLSTHPHVQIFLEDHYYSHSDAAVVFKRVDTENNDVRYIYHGNDGTSIPWNDTAQLDFLQKQVREHVINTILHVAKMFPIIRLDAAMVLTKKHFQRLWYPVPGTGGDIPSRSRYGLNQEQFDKLFPVEFWREVVDRIETDAPNTLLIAEAFWMLEGYFVRTLGVHRVYNSAFMHMLRDQKNEEYRGLLKSTLTYDPRILQRYVNFMSNPDEDTAIEQFGDSDKYFGVTVMMATLPGLPMFGHGQIEGYREKYGMEFQRDYWNETADNQLIDSHKQLIFPLLRKRYLFAQVKHFRLYDFYHPDGYVIEDVFALSNRVNTELILVFYNNAMDSRTGWIKTTLPFNAALINQGETDHYQSNLAEELENLAQRSTVRNPEFCIFKNFYGDQYYIQKLSEIREKGFYTELQGYQFKIFSEFTLYAKSDELQELYEETNGNTFSRAQLAELGE